MSAAALVRGLAVVLALVVIGGTAVGLGPGAHRAGVATTGGPAPSPSLVARRVRALGSVASVGRGAFADSGCGGCHTLAAADAHASVGPDLDDALTDADVAQIERDVDDPNATIAAGFPKDVMPGDFGRRLTRSQLDALARWLAATTASP